ncbi:deoxyguanosinetriphosphate triphosphohydrolase family protein [Ferruginibacter sp. HRS2-29]|uniref:deoxyguanosinetriphosphate triphosphohydrolase family protein n=1 Tax=Ferruginibacter sp. HRS2-29 TaxID=2487334 RepID=UPI0020CEB456|nr:dNTP triphosphohydrolase [Ferruginibacter sp. HRS2-29]MCP9749498.1 dNTP triphosphohydrolase [Ferruginibacter sp. HRS2-29]
MYQKGDEVKILKETESVLGEESYRTCYRRDYARVLHSHSFRRLQGKQQLYPGLESDFFRSRLTHSLEVAQIAKSIGIRLNSENEDLKKFGFEINTDILEFAGLAHDIGHPPFGHKGEHALDDMMKSFGGFEGNAQTLRVLTKLEKKFKPEEHRVGLNLTMRSLAAILKYDKEIPLKREDDEKLSKGYYLSDRELIKKIKESVLNEPDYTGEFKTIECGIMDLADDIAYSVFDLEDGLKAGFYTLFDFIYSQDRSVSETIFKKVAEKLGKRGIDGVTEKTVYKTIEDIIYFLFGYPDIPEQVKTFGPQEQIKFFNQFYYSLNLAYGQEGRLRTQTSSHLIGKFIRGIEFEFNADFPQLSKVKFNPDILLQVETLKLFVYEFIVNSPRILISELRGFDIVTSIFKAIQINPKLLPKENFTFYVATTDEVRKNRIICDFVAGMTDRYAIEFYGRLKSMDPVTIFKEY